MRRSLAACAIAFLVAAADAQDPGAKPAPAPPAKDGGSEAAVVAGLDWLARHQSPDGRWSAAGFASRCEGAKCAGAGTPIADVGVTALSVLAFLGFGETHQKGAHRDVVKNALNLLRDLQNEDGFLGTHVPADARLQHAYAAMAVCEAYGMTASKVFKPVAAAAAKATAAMQDASGGWKLADGDAACDPLLTSVCVLALRDAKMSDLDFDVRTFDHAVLWFDAQAKTSPSAADARTAESLAARIFARYDLDALTKDPLFAKDADVLGAHPPQWTDKTAASDLWTWCLAAPPLFQRGGDVWTAWWRAFRDGVVARGRGEKDGCARGSWDAVEARRAAHGRGGTRRRVAPTELPHDDPRRARVGRARPRGPRFHCIRTRPPDRARASRARSRPRGERRKARTATTTRAARRARSPRAGAARGGNTALRSAWISNR